MLSRILIPLALVLAMTASPAFAHLSPVPHDHPHDHSWLLGWDMIALAALLLVLVSAALFNKPIRRRIERIMKRGRS